MSALKLWSPILIFNGGSDSSYIIYRAQELGSLIAHITYKYRSQPLLFRSHSFRTVYSRIHTITMILRLHKFHRGAVAGAVTVQSSPTDLRAHRNQFH